MPLAHSITPGGPDLELTIFAGALLILSVVFFLTKSAKPAVSVVLLLGALGLGAGAFALADSPSSTLASVAIASPGSGKVVAAGKPVRLRVAVEGGKVAAQTSSRNQDAGHLHVFVDDRLVAMPSSVTPKVRLEPGRHSVTVEYVDYRHASFSPKVVAQIDLRAR